MLTLQKPIEINSIKKLNTISYSINQNIIANYTLLNMRIEENDLLHLITPKFEVQGDSSIFNAICTNNESFIIQNLDFNVINNLINRIIINQNDDFTYQDNVYITSVLNKLGIENIQEFINQINDLKKTNESVYNLKSLYENNFLKSYVKVANEMIFKSESNETSISEVKNNNERIYLHNKIYEKLETKNIYDIILAFHKSQIDVHNTLQKNELKLAEFKRVSNILELYNSKKIYNENNSALSTNQINKYEQIDGNLNIYDENSITQRIGIIALSSIIENAFLSRIENFMEEKDYFIEINNSIENSIENAIFRFKNYAKSSIYDNHINNFSSEYIINSLQEEQNIVQNLISNILDFKNNLGFNYLSEVQKNSENLFQYLINQNSDDELLEEEKVIKYKMSNEDIIKNTQQMFFAGNKVNNIKNNRNLENEIITNINENKKINLLQINRYILENIKYIDALKFIDKSKNLVLNSNFENNLQETVFNIDDNIFENFKKISKIYINSNADIKNNINSNDENFIIVQKNFENNTINIEENNSNDKYIENLKQTLKQMDIKNRHALQQSYSIQNIENKNIDINTLKNKMIDISTKILNNNSIESILEENNFISSKTENNIEHLIKTLPEESQKIYKTFIEYTKNPTEYIKSGIIKEMSASEFTSDIGSIVNETINKNIKSTSSIEELDIEKIDKVYKNNKIIESEVINSYIKQDFVHKKNQDFVIDGLYENLLKTQVTENKSVNNIDKETQTNENITETKNITKNIIENATEDITEIINKTIAKNIASISDTVFTKMERKLKNERSRRGF